jgi:hypothetical protein
MNGFERIDTSWEQAERFRHAALLRQLKAELQEVRQRSRPSAPLSLPVPKEQPSQPDPGIIKRVRS